MCEKEIQVQNEAALQPSQSAVMQSTLQPNEVMDQVVAIQNMMSACMKSGEHYGTIPGCGDKPTLLKPGAEKLSLMFQLAPSYRTVRTDYPGNHREYEVTCTITHIPTGLVRAEGLGSCTTLEGKYKFRVAPKEITDKPVPREYWDARKENPVEAEKLLGGKGFGTKKTESGWFITKGTNEKVEHDNPPDYWNTCMKMAKKRAYVDAMLSATAASDIFTQDIEDMPEVIPAVNIHQKQAAPAQEEEQQQQQAEQNQALHETAWNLFDTVKGKLDEAGRNWGADQLKKHNYQSVIDWINGAKN